MTKLSLTVVLASVLQLQFIILIYSVDVWPHKKHIERFESRDSVDLKKGINMYLMTINMPSDCG